MAVLMVPQSARMIRRTPGLDKKKAGKWHFVKTKCKRLCICGELVSRLYEVEYSALEQVKEKEICAKCWPFSLCQLSSLN